MFQRFQNKQFLISLKKFIRALPNILLFYLAYRLLIFLGMPDNNKNEKTPYERSLEARNEYENQNKQTSGMELNISLEEFSKKSELSISTIRKVENDGRLLSLTTMQKYVNLGLEKKFKIYQFHLEWLH